jgi:glycosyltransferase involved in cell wall biosynthesis
MRPKVSVIVPVYNCAKYLLRCLESLNNQKLEDIEIIIINDGSTDNSLNIINEFAKNKHKTIKIINQINSGVSLARNSGIIEAVGEFITFVDADDTIDENMLIEMYNSAKLKKKSIVFTNFGSENKVYKNRNLNKLEQETIQYKSIDYTKKMLLGELPRTACGILFSKNVIESNKLMFNRSLEYGEDFIFTIETLLNTDEILFINKPFYIVTQRSNSASRKLNSKHFSHVEKIEKILKWKLLNYTQNNKLTKELFTYIQSEIIVAIEKLLYSNESYCFKKEKLIEIKKSKLFESYFKHNKTTKLFKKIVIIRHFPPSIILAIYRLFREYKFVKDYFKGVVSK